MENMYTLKKSYEGLYKEKGSKFISFIFPVSGVDDVKQKLEMIKSRHPGAKNICYAFRLGEKGQTEKAFDSGEPKGSAGLPILNQLRSKQFTNVLLVVVRYYGGSKLGISGLINAFKESSRDVLSKTRMHVFEQRFYCRIQFPVSELGLIEKLIRTEKWMLEESTYGNECNFLLSCKQSEKDNMIGKFEGSERISVLKEM